LYHVAAERKLHPQSVLWERFCFMTVCHKAPLNSLSWTREQKNWEASASKCYQINVKHHSREIVNPILSCDYLICVTLVQSFLDLYYANFVMVGVWRVSVWPSCHPEINNLKFTHTTVWKLRMMIWISSKKFTAKPAPLLQPWLL
jgi:hypothetical protein